MCTVIFIECERGVKYGAKMANRFCRVCCSSLGANQYLLVKYGALSIAGEALLRLTELSCRVELRDGEAPRLCKSCYDTVVRMKKTYDDLEGKKAALQEKLSTARTFFLGSKHVRVSSPRSRIPWIDLIRPQRCFLPRHRPLKANDTAPSNDSSMIHRSVETSRVRSDNMAR